MQRLLQWKSNEYYTTFKLELFYPEVFVQYNGVKVSQTQQQ
jgi:hypothetical protein